MNLNEIYRLPPTQRIYNRQPYLTSLQATVLYTEDNLAVFDKTLFYAESGGQIYDTGLINDNQVISVKKYLGELSKVNNPQIDVPSVKINTRIVHEFSAPVCFRAGDIVTMNIDWNRRYNIMKNHTLAHFLFYGINYLFNKTGNELFLKGCAINDEKAGFSLNNKITNEDINEIEDAVRSVFEPDIRIEMVPEQTNDEVYYWKYKDIIIPCGGTHLKNTAELAGFKIWRKSEGKNKTKVYIKEDGCC